MDQNLISRWGASESDTRIQETARAPTQARWNEVKDWREGWRHDK